MPPKGTSMSPEHRAKIGDAQRGVAKSKKHKAAIRRGVVRYYARRETA